MRAAIIGLAVAITTPSVINAQQCGEAPIVSDQSLKGDLEGKAKFLSGYLGEAGLKGQMESARTDVLSKYPNADRARIETYMLYMLCKTILGDSTLTAQEKIKMMLEVQQSLRR